MLLLMSDSESVASSSTLFSTFIFSFQFEKSVLVPKKNVKILKRKKNGRLEIHEADGSEAPVFLCLNQQLRPEYI